MNPSTAQAVVLVDELVRNRVEHAVLCPGSRNAPLSFALAEAESRGRLRLHVRIDERSAAFLALGLAASSGRFVPVVCTSGTAVANLHPAMLEAWHAQVPLLALTADRPPELLGTGANQTTRQHGLFGPHVSTVDFPIAERRTGQNAAWRALLCRTLGTGDGPVHLNVPFREPLVPGGVTGWPEALEGRADGGPWTSIDRFESGPPAAVEIPARTVLVLGSGPRTVLRTVAGLAARKGWPVIAEPPAAPVAAATGARVIRHGALLLGGLPDRLVPDAVVVAGRPTLARSIQRLIGSAPLVHVVDDARHYADPQYAAARVHRALDARGEVDANWLPEWDRAAERATTALASTMDQAPWPTGLHVADEIVRSVPPGSALFLGSSNPVRDVDLMTPARPDIDIYANRGLAGIDGSIATASGIALHHGGPAYALMGDLTFLHDVGGLLVTAGETRPDLTVVVVNDGGGGIFSLLEQGAPEFRASFERVFGTPHGVNLRLLCAGYGVEYAAPASAAEFRKALAPAPGLRMVEVRTDRSGLRSLHEQLRLAIRD